MSTSTTPRRRRTSGLSELAWAVSPWAPAPKPHRSGDVTPEFVTASCGSPGSVALAVEDADGTTGTTDRRRIRVTWNDHGRESELPETLFVKSTPLSAKNRAMVGPLSMAVNEVRFYNEARPGLPDDIAPRAFAAHAGRGARHLLLLEDLHARGATTFSMADDVELDHLQGTIAALAQLHGAFWNSPRFADDLAWLAPQTSRPGFAMLKMTFRRVRKTLVGSDQHALSPETERLALFLNDHDTALYEQWLQGPQTFLHGDSHVGNTYQLADGTSGLLDWQVVHRGPGLREFAYFVGSSVPIEMRRAHEEDLLRLYLEVLSKTGVDPVPSFDAAWERYLFFLFDAWDSASICRVWPGLQTPEAVRAAHQRADAAIEDHRVADVLRAALR